LIDARRWTDQPRRIGLLSVHTSPLEQPGTGDSGGMNVAVASLAQQLAARGIGVDVFTRRSGPDLPETVILPDGVRVHHIDAGPPGARKGDLTSHLCAFYLGVAAHPAIARLDLLHGHYWMSGWVGRQASKRLRLPLVQTFHTLGKVKNAALAPGDRPEPPLRLAAEDRIVGDAQAVLAATEEEAAELRRHYHAPPSRVHVVEPGVDLEVFSPALDRDAARQALGGGRILLFVGRLQPLKAPDVAVRTLARLDALLPDDGLPTRLVIVGGPSGDPGTASPPNLRRLAADLGVADRIAFLAARPQPELAALYRAADVVLMPSHTESFGLVALEAQACGTPVVAADVGGLRHVVGPYGGGTVVAGHDADAWARAALPYLVDARTRVAAGRAGRRHAEGHGWARTAASTVEVYRSVLREHRDLGVLAAPGGA
jgi:D-inositol-3-phosphate glycosyltransferase